MLTREFLLFSQAVTYGQFTCGGGLNDIATGQCLVSQSRRSLVAISLEMREMQNI